jgi:hypothetical protein
MDHPACLRRSAFRRHLRKANFGPLTPQSCTAVAHQERNSWMGEGSSDQSCPACLRRANRRPDPPPLWCLTPWFESIERALLNALPDGIRLRRIEVGESVPRLLRCRRRRLLSAPHISSAWRFIHVAAAKWGSGSRSSSTSRRTRLASCEANPTEAAALSRFIHPDLNALFLELLTQTRKQSAADPRDRAPVR